MEPLICGVDEAGRGPLVGPVYAAAVILPQQHDIIGLKDSKKLSALQRERLFTQIQDKSIAWAVASASSQEIDTLNILQATMLAMRRAVDLLPIIPDEVWVDGNCVPVLNIPARSIIRGDALELVISAASILAKVSRDREMVQLDIQYPGYGFSQHKGYPTAAHLLALSELGPTPIHRRSFGPVKLAFAKQKTAAS